MYSWPANRFATFAAGTVTEPENPPAEALAFQPVTESSGIRTPALSLNEAGATDVVGPWMWPAVEEWS